jgi:outer membrane protein OmpA-like peptidoglycan-associated protein
MLLVALMGAQQHAQQPTAPAQQPAAPTQQPIVQTEKVHGISANAGNAPTTADIYCAGFLTTQRISTARVVVGGMTTPEQTRYASTTSNIFIHGSGMKVGDRLEILRHAKDPNHYEAFPSQRAWVRITGSPYFELGYVRVIEVQNNVAIATPELTCSPYVPGDIAVPFVERQAPVFRNVTLDRYTPRNGKAAGRIIMAAEFDTILGSRAKAYLNIGADKGLQPGDYLRATRTYGYAKQLPADSLSFKGGEDDTQKDAPRQGNVSGLPRRTLGDMMVLDVHRKSATVMILTALETIYVGDVVELMDTSAFPPVSSTTTTAPPVEEPAVASPPTISCTASPASVRLDEVSTITCNAVSTDNRPLTITFSASAGKLSPNNNVAVLDTSNAGPGQVNVRATVYDDRQLSAFTSVAVNVEPPPAVPVAQKMSDLDFKTNSAYVNNLSKAVLDDVALKLQQNPQSTVLLSGAAGEKESPKLAERRAQNAKDYLTKSKGIDSNRVQVRTSLQPGHKAEVWTVPAGASAPPQ